MKKIVYYLGAGASANVLPIVANFTSRLASLSQNIENILKSDEKTQDVIENRELYTQFYNDLRWLVENSRSHASIDTFAKKLYIKNDLDNLKKLKSLLNAFFLIEQGRSNVDMRYDAFLASVISVNSFNEISIPGNIKMLNWNYDNQIEKAYYGFCGDFEKVYKEITFNRNQFYHFNGYAGTSQSGHLGKKYFSLLSNEKSIISVGIKLYKECLDLASIGSIDIRYAWENETKNKLRNCINEIQLDDAEQMVIIGYSFPYYNLEIDSEIFSTMKNLKRIFLQMPETSCISVQERLSALGVGCKIENIKGLDLFYIPYR